VPGDVVVATVKGRENVRVVAGWSRYDPQLRWCELSPRWADGDDDECWYFPSDVADPRPLVVIDPEDREQVEALMAALPAYLLDKPVSRVQDGLRSLIADPKPEEPLGLGAVVEDDKGRTWVSAYRDGRTKWVPSNGSRFPTNYDDVAAVKVLSEGVS
jgi:hypothetical protein